MDMLNSAQVAELLAVSQFTIRLWRIEGKGPRFIKMNPGKRAPVRYAKTDVEAWLRERTFASTSAYSAKGGTQ
jgi:hypothetical protein